MHERANCALSEDEYYHIVDGKTAELCALCCFLGAHFASAGEAAAAAMGQYGRSLGMAFQIADDLLDIVGSEHETGKSLRTDFKKQKLTLPLIRLLETAEEPEGSQILEVLSNPDESGWHSISQWLECSDAIDYASGRAETFAHDARRRLALLEDTPERRILEELTEFCCQRSY